jgi:hypothetical protein
MHRRSIVRRNIGVSLSQPIQIGILQFSDTNERGDNPARRTGHAGVEQTIDEYFVSGIPRDWFYGGAHTVRFYNDLIPEPPSLLIAMVHGALFRAMFFRRTLGVKHAPWRYPL